MYIIQQNAIDFNIFGKVCKIDIDFVKYSCYNRAVINFIFYNYIVKKEKIMFFLNLLDELDVRPTETCGSACYDYCSGVSSMSSCDSICSSQCVSACTSVDQKNAEVGSGGGGSGGGDDDTIICIACTASCGILCSAVCVNVSSTK